MNKELIMLLNNLGTPLAVCCAATSAGAHIRTVQSSEAEAIIRWYTGFHDTQFTVLEWPVRVAIGRSLFICHT